MTWKKKRCGPSFQRYRARVAPADAKGFCHLTARPSCRLRSRVLISEVDAWSAGVQAALEGAAVSKSGSTTASVGLPAVTAPYA